MTTISANHNTIAQKNPLMWTDVFGDSWKIVESKHRLKFSIPCHAALRRHVFYLDNFQCRRCGAEGVNVPGDYDGSFVLETNTSVSTGHPDMLILDHILTMAAGGRSVVENLQTLCETCNRRKIREDNIASAAYRMQNNV